MGILRANRLWYFFDLGTPNPNVRNYTRYSLLMMLSNGIMFSGLFASYLYLMTDDNNSKVGFAEAIFGFCSLIPGMAAGYYADKKRRDKALRVAGVFHIIGSVATFVVVMTSTIVPNATSYSDDLHKDIKGIGSLEFLLICIGVSILYCAQSISDGSSEALLADSLVTGVRLQYFSKVQIWNNAARSLGPIISILIFCLLGNKWTLKSLGIVISTGLAFRFPAGLTCFFFKDRESLLKGGQSNSVLSISRFQSSKYKYVPLYYSISTILWCFGSGMTVKFLLIWFQTNKKDGLDLSPVSVLSITAVQPLLVIPSTKTIEWLSLKVGRVQADFIFWISGILAFTGMIIMGYTGHFTTHMSDRIILVGLFLFRKSVLSSTDSIKRSIVMDYVKPKHRGRWASLDQLGNVGWSGSAAVGGVLIDHYSYQFTFTVTAILHVISLVPKIPLLYLVPRMQQKAAASAKTAIKILCLSGRDLSYSDIIQLARFLLPTVARKSENELLEGGLVN
eukprot:TRINITY_DN22369_c0_g1_i1.p1 TRINITY_DN22369_c0_g1~~TRINITY_DN22369_c0_g1_i1.p1  ORF type:complete len:506 (+),score=70.88 TRINITY_DN22369_c0_g1_i1:40-1557(+)